MCGTPMVEVRASHVRGRRWQDWQCPRCLHTEHDVYEGRPDDGADEGAD